MEYSKRPSLGLWCWVAAALPIAGYGAVYGFLRWQVMLIYDVRYCEDPNGVSYSQLGVTYNYYSDDTAPWQKMLARPAVKVFFPLCEIETRVRWELQTSGWRDQSLE
jgi:hypothetical protein